MFPPIVVVVSENWVNDPDASEWDGNLRAKVTFMPIEYLANCFFLCLFDRAPFDIGSLPND